jgi:hypothetical protein
MRDRAGESKLGGLEMVGRRYSLRRVRKTGEGVGAGLEIRLQCLQVIPGEMARKQVELRGTHSSAFVKSPSL